MTWKELKRELERRGVVDNDVVMLPTVYDTFFPQTQSEVRVETKQNSANVKLIYGVR